MARSARPATPANTASARSRARSSSSFPGGSRFSASRVAFSFDSSAFTASTTGVGQLLELLEPGPCRVGLGLPVRRRALGLEPGELCLQLLGIGEVTAEERALVVELERLGERLGGARAHPLAGTARPARRVP